jgi:hypothetical protein
MDYMGVGTWSGIEAKIVWEVCHVTRDESISVHTSWMMNGYML